MSDLGEVSAATQRPVWVAGRGVGDIWLADESDVDTSDTCVGVFDGSEDGVGFGQPRDQWQTALESPVVAEPEAISEGEWLMGGGELSAAVAEADSTGTGGDWLSIDSLFLFSPAGAVSTPENQVLLTDHSSLSALYRITASAAAVDALVHHYETWDDLAISSPYSRAAKLGPWAASLRFPRLCPPIAPPGPGVRVLSRYDGGDYPDALLRMAFPPPLIYLRGIIPQRSLIAIGGTHHPTAHGIHRSRVSARVAQMLGLSVTASLDTGCGRAALEESVRAGMPALAVAGASLESAGPNDWLIESLLDNGGGVISAYPPGTSWAEMGCIFGSELVAALGHLVVIAEFGLHVTGGLPMVQAAMRGGRPLISFTHGQEGVALWASSLLTRGGVLVNSSNQGDLPPELSASPRASERAKAGLPLADAVVRDAAGLERAVLTLSG